MMATGDFYQTIEKSKVFFTVGESGPEHCWVNLNTASAADWNIGYSDPQTEWRCEYCQTLNKAKAVKCRGCQASR